MYHLSHDMLPEPERAAFCAALLASPLLGRSPLGPEFVATRGYSIVCHRSAWPEVLAAHPALAAPLSALAFPQSNAFYLNPIVLGCGSRVETHLDCRLLEATAGAPVRILPTLVSIWYARFDPEVEGGTLVLAPDTPDEVRLRPRSNDRLHFPGRTLHRVEPVVSDHTRIALVCEQYHLSEALLAAFPRYRVVPGLEQAESGDALPRVRGTG